jgi:predicted nucleic acid-binding protein
LIFIVDASVAVKWFIKEDLHEQAIALSEFGHELIAPNLIFAEVANVLRRRVRLGHISSEQAARAVGNLGDAFKDIVPIERVIGSAFEKSAELDHSVYDIVYLVCALERPGSFLVTSDVKFEAKARAGGFGEKVLSLEVAHARFLTSRENDNG